MTLIRILIALCPYGLLVMLRRLLIFAAAFAIGLVATELPAFALSHLYSGVSSGGGPVPSVPTGLTTATGSSGQIGVNWSANPSGDNVTLYILSRATGASQPCSSASVVDSANALSFTDTGLTPGGTYTYCLVAQNVNGNSASTAGVNGTAGSSSDQLAALKLTLSPGQWAPTSNQVSTDSLMDNVKWTCSASCAPWATEASVTGAEAPSQVSIYLAWGGGTYDPLTNSIIIMGGGHHDGFGNDVYGFSLTTLQWSILRPPSDISSWAGGCANPDGSWHSSHTYDSLAAIGNTGKIMVAGGAGYNTNGDSTNCSFIFDTSADTFTQKASGVNLAGFGSGDNITVYDATSGDIYTAVFGGGLNHYTVSTNTWTQPNNNNLPDYHLTGAIDPVNRLIYAVGNTHLVTEDLSGNVTTITATGDLTCQNYGGSQGQAAPGFVWDSRISKFVCWSGGTPVYVLDPVAHSWTKFDAGGAVPTCNGGGCSTDPMQTDGTFGRFVYQSSDDMLCEVNSLTDHVYCRRSDDLS